MFSVLEVMSWLVPRGQATTAVVVSSVRLCYFIYRRAYKYAFADSSIY